MARVYSGPLVPSWGPERLRGREDKQNCVLGQVGGLVREGGLGGARLPLDRGNGEAGSSGSDLQPNQTCPRGLGAAPALPRWNQRQTGTLAGPAVTPAPHTQQGPLTTSFLLPLTDLGQPKESLETDSSGFYGSNASQEMLFLQPHPQPGSSPPKIARPFPFSRRCSVRNQGSLCSDPESFLPSVPRVEGIRLISESHTSEQNRSACSLDLLLNPGLQLIVGDTNTGKFSCLPGRSQVLRRK